MDAFLKQAMNGNQENVKKLYEETKEKVYLLCSSLISNKEAVAIVFEDVYKEIWKIAPQKNLDSVKDFKDLLMKTAVKFCQNEEFSGNPHIFKDNKPTEFNQVEYKPCKATISYGDVMQNCMKLSAPSRFIFLAYLMSDLDVRQIGQVINVEEIIVDSYIQDAIYQLKDHNVNEFKSACNVILEIPNQVNENCLNTIEEITNSDERVGVPPIAIIPILLGLFFIAYGVFGYIRDSKTQTQPTQVQEEATETVVAKDYIAEIVVKDYGTIKMELDGKVAPITVNNFVDLANQGFYDGLTFHRIMDGFMIQGGDPNGNGTGGSDHTIKGEFNSNGIENNISHVRGTVSMARSQDPNSASSQFFIVQSDSTFLDGDYAGFGRVLEGMEIVDQICQDKIPVDNNGTILAEDQPIIETIRVQEK